MNSLSYVYVRVRSPTRSKEKGPDRSGPFKREEENLVAGDHRTAKVEAIDELAAGGLDVLARILIPDEATRNDRRQRRRGEPGAEQRVLGPVARVAILGLPEQARDQVEPVFVASAEEPAPVSLRRKGEGRGGIVDEVLEGDAFEARLRVAAGDVGQQAWHDHISKPAAGRPCIFLPLFAPYAKAAGADDARRLQVAPQSAPVIVAERADDPAVGELVIATHLNGAEPAPPACVGLACGERNVRRVVRAVTLIEHAVTAAGAHIAAGPVRRDHGRG